ncbi:hypothetical protein J3R83DRAFT_4255, partial [Lanmaoa asiatica]
MADRRGYSFPPTELDRGSQWPTGTQHSSRYPAPSNAYQGVPASSYPSIAGTTHNMASVHPSVQYGVNDYTGNFPPSVSSQYTAATPNAYHQPRQSYPPQDYVHQAPNAVSHYTVPSQQYPAPQQQPSIHHTSPYYGRGDSQYQQPQYPASPSRPFSCDLCALSFNRQHDLKRHRETHSGEKPFLCNGGCGKTFTRKDALKRHQ